MMPTIDGDSVSVSAADVHIDMIAAGCENKLSQEWTRQFTLYLCTAGDCTATNDDSKFSTDGYILIDAVILNHWRCR